jgi:hypothetical protein
MKTFYQFLEALSSHGGFTMPHGDEFKPSLNEKDTEYISGMYKRPLVISSRSKLRGGIISVLDTVLARVKGFNFHIYFGEYNRDDIDIQKYFFDKIPKEDIVFLKKSSQGDLLTPWMILHNMGHAVFQMGNSSSKDTIKMAVFNLVKHLTSGGRPFTTVDKKNDDDVLLSVEFKPNEILPLLFNFASAKSTVENKTVQDADELAYEIFVSYLYGGGKLKRPDFKKLTTFCFPFIKIDKRKVPISYAENYVYTYVNNAFITIEKEIKKSLEYCRGKVIED